MAGLWFKTESVPGKANLLDQMIGLDHLWPLVKDQSILDVGCAEGLIAFKCMEHGARSIRGIDNRRMAIQFALAGNSYHKAHFECTNAENYLPTRHDVVLLLSVLHKFREPTQVFWRMLTSCNHCCVVRVPNGCWPVLRDSRSGNKPILLEAIAEECGFVVDQIVDGPIDSDRGPQAVVYLRRALV